MSFRVFCFGSRTVFLVALRGLNCSAACEILVPRPRIKPMSHALQGRFLTTGPPGKFPGLPIFKEDIISRQGILKGWWPKEVCWSLALSYVFCPRFFWCLEKVLRASPMTWAFLSLFRLFLRCFNFEWHFCNIEFHPFPQGSSLQRHSSTYSGRTLAAFQLPPPVCSPLLTAPSFRFPGLWGGQCLHDASCWETSPVHTLHWFRYRNSPALTLKNLQAAAKW